MINMNEKSYTKKLGKNIARIRKREGYSQDRLVLEGDFSRGTISKIENGLTSPKVYTLARIAEVLNVTLAELITVK